MAKKNFNKGLEDIFINPDGETNTSVLDEAQEDQAHSSEPESTHSKTKKKKKSYRKNFTYDLNSLLDDAMAETRDMELSEDRESKKTHSPKRHIKKVPLTGINALIRRTVDIDYEEERRRETKRVTFICEREKINQLKKIAKNEKTYLKDILIGLIDQYLKNYKN